MTGLCVFDAERPKNTILTGEAGITFNIGAIAIGCTDRPTLHF